MWWCMLVCRCTAVVYCVFLQAEGQLGRQKAETVEGVAQGRRRCHLSQCVCGAGAGAAVLLQYLTRGWCVVDVQKPSLAKSPACCWNSRAGCTTAHLLPCTLSPCCLVWRHDAHLPLHMLYLCVYPYEQLGRWRARSLALCAEGPGEQLQGRGTLHGGRITGRHDRPQRRDVHRSPGREQGRRVSACSQPCRRWSLPDLSLSWLNYQGCRIRVAGHQLWRRRWNRAQRRR